MGLDRSKPMVDKMAMIRITFPPTTYLAYRKTYH